MNVLATMGSARGKVGTQLLALLDTQPWSGTGRGAALAGHTTLGVVPLVAR